MRYFSYTRINVEKPGPSGKTSINFTGSRTGHVFCSIQKPWNIQVISVMIIFMKCCALDGGYICSEKYAHLVLQKAGIVSFKQLVMEETWHSVLKYQLCPKAASRSMTVSGTACNDCTVTHCATECASISQHPRRLCFLLSLSPSPESFLSQKTLLPQGGRAGLTGHHPDLLHCTIFLCEQDKTLPAPKIMANPLAVPKLCVPVTSV